MSNGMQLPILVEVGSQHRLEGWVYRVGLRMQDVKMVRAFKDITGYKDRQLYVLEAVIEDQAIGMYCEMHNIERIEV